MLIKQIQVFQLSIPLIEPFIISLGTLCFADNLVVRITAYNGFVYRLFGQIAAPEIPGHGAGFPNHILNALVQSKLKFAI
jgi:hypothetical protein